MASEEQMIIDSEKKTSELKLNQPKPFTGKQTKFDDFLQDIELYLDINEDIYNTNKKKIGYALSFMNKGDAKSWKGQFIQNAQGPTRLDLGTWTQFVKELTNGFQPYDAPRDVLEHLTNMKAMSIEEQNELMKKGACFRCKKTGHLSKDCLIRNKVARTTQKVQKKMTPKEMYKHIQSLTAQLNDKEKMEFFKEAEEEGF